MKSESDDRPTSETKTTRRHLSAEDKIRLLRLHLLEGKPISEICDENGISPSNFYGWQKTFFENGAAAFDRSPRSRRLGQGELRIAELEAKIKRKEDVIAMVTEELVRSKKELGEFKVSDTIVTCRLTPVRPRGSIPS